MAKIALENLTAEDKQKLLQELEAEQKEKQKLIVEQRANYKTLVDEQVTKLFPILKDASKKLEQVKNECFKNFKALIELKAELYDKEVEQTSHSFTNKEGTITIIVGKNQIDGWNDTVTTGVEKVKDYISSLGKDKDSKALVKAVLKLLSRDVKGNLKASRILQLKQMADETENKGFIDAVAIIQEAYRPVLSKEFVRCIYTDATGVKLQLPLSITEAAMLQQKEEEE